MPTGVYDRKKKSRKPKRKTSMIPLEAIPARATRGTVVRRKPPLEVAQLQLAAEIVRLLSAVLSKGA